jgi:hypothetical protein
MSERRDFPAWIYIASFILIVVVAILPIIVTIIGIAVAQVYGCQITESAVSPCLIGGTDYGADLQAAGNSFWLILLSAPVAFLIFLVWLAIFIIHLVVANRRRRAVAP